MDELTTIQPTDTRWDEPLNYEMWFVYVTFEQGRGKGGVPRAAVQAWRGMSVDSLLRVSVEMMRALCADEALGHGQDLMPGDDYSEYELHQTHGGVITDIKDVLFVQRPKGGCAAKLVLTYGEPNRRLLKEIKP